jgi:predicted amidohydrolase YtcJ
LLLAPGEPDLVIRNARIVTMDRARPEAEALAIRGERIVAVGTNEESSAWIGPSTRVLDLSGPDSRTIIPGINETHIHVRDLGFQQRQAVNLEGAKNVADVQRLLRDRLDELRGSGKLGGWHYPTTGETGDWLFGLGWTQDRLDEKRMASRRELDAVSRDVPISLDRIYRGIAVNTKVFELMGIDFDDPSTYPEWFRRTPRDFQPGDIIFRDESGLPNGVFVGERAPRLILGGHSREVAGPESGEPRPRSRDPRFLRHHRHRGAGKPARAGHEGLSGSLRSRPSAGESHDL